MLELAYRLCGPGGARLAGWTDSELARLTWLLSEPLPPLPPDLCDIWPGDSDRTNGVMLRPFVPDRPLLGRVRAESLSSMDDGAVDGTPVDSATVRGGEDDADMSDETTEDEFDSPVRGGDGDFGSGRPACWREEGAPVIVEGGGATLTLPLCPLTCRRRLVSGPWFPPVLRYSASPPSQSSGCELTYSL